MVTIRLEKAYTYEELDLQFDEAETVMFVMENKRQREDLLALLLGKKRNLGNCAIANASVLTDIKEYKKKIDYIDPQKIDSNMSVQKYLVFFAMLCGVYSEDTVDKVAKQLKKIKMAEKLDEIVNHLSRQEKILVRSIAASLKEVDLLVADQILLEGQKEENRRLVSFLKENFVNQDCLCILVEDKEKPVDETIVDKIIII